MSKILVLGGGVIGLSTAMMLERDGHDVIVLERDPERVPASPDDAWQRWERRGVGQFRQPHYVHPAGRLVLEAHLPEVEAALLGAGATTFDALTLLPPSIEDRAPRPGDERFVSVTGRRPVIEYAVASVADRHLEVNAAIEGRALPEPTDPAARVRAALLIAIRYDADVFRAFTEINSLLALPREVMSRPGLVDSILEAARGRELVAPPGPSRAELLRMMA
jgi:hypothetical protein